MWHYWHEAIWRYGRWDMWHPGAIIGLVLLVLIIVLVIVGIVALVGHGGSKSAIRENSALTIARERYARGEISKEQFEQMKKDLS
jgi:putative membrane protein